MYGLRKEEPKDVCLSIDALVGVVTCPCNAGIINSSVDVNTCKSLFDII